MTTSIWTHRRPSAVPRFSNSRNPMSEAARTERNGLLIEQRRPYIADGITQQGRLTPTRLQRQHADFVNTIPTGPMPFHPAEACTDNGADDEEARMGSGAGVVLIPLAVIAVIAMVALYRALPSF